MDGRLVGCGLFSLLLLRTRVRGDCFRSGLLIILVKELILESIYRCFR